jgi:preprotein translocase subunit SecA
MDYLREGIGLRAMGQKDPLVEYQREGFEMFGEMMQGVSQDFVTYVMHAQVVAAERPAAEAAAVSNVQYSAPADPSEAKEFAGAAAPARGAVGGAAPAPVPDEPVSHTPLVKDEWDRTGRNDPCPCGSGRKYKHCHGR